MKNSTEAPSPYSFVSTHDGILIAYSPAGSQFGVGIVQTWKLSPNGDFVVLSEPRLLDFWSHIVPTVNGLVLFYGADTGRSRAMTGLITPEGAPGIKNFTGFDPWAHVVSTSDGILLSQH